MIDAFSRTERLIGKKAMAQLKACHVAVFGIGGVGGYVVEALARSGIGALDLIDHDRVDITNINRQIIALHSNIGRLKVDVMKERILDINPDVKVETYSCFYLPENADTIDFSKYDYVVDAIDTVTGKLSIIERANQACIPVISAMGAGNKLDPTAFEVADLYKTSVCPLARVMRRECKKRGIQQCKVVYSKEPAISIQTKEDRPVPGSISFVPSVAGLILAGEVIKDLIELKKQNFLETERLILRPFQNSDASALYELAKDPRVGPIAGWPAHQSVEESKQVIEHVLNGNECYAVVKKESSVLIGAIELKPSSVSNLTDRLDACELGFWLGYPYWSKGYMSEAATCLLTYAFEDLKMQEVWCAYYAGNDRSQTIQKRLGFVPVRVIPNEPIPLLHMVKECHVQRMTPSDWDKKNCDK